MPMSWTPENDRLLLLKLVETSGISVNAEAIVKAWPGDASSKPTARAIKERFVRLRHMAGAGAVKGKMTVTTPSKLRQPKTPSTSAKKRKIQEEASESDADDHFTEEETPTSKRKSAQHGGAFIGRGQKLGEGNKNGTGSGPKNSQRAGASNAMGVRIKTEKPDDTTFDDNAARASKLKAALNDPFDTYNTAGAADPFAYNGGSGYGMVQQSSFSNPDGFLDNMHNYGSGMQSYGATGMDLDLDHNTNTLVDDREMTDIPGQPGQRMPVSFFQNATGILRKIQGEKQTQQSRASAAPSDGSSGRARPTRKASQIMARLREKGSKTSEEDSMGSEYHESEDEV